MKTLFFSIIALFFSTSVVAQKSINDFKYVLIPEKFEFQKEADQYQLNSLTKFLFNKYGYIAYFLSDDLPEDLNKDRCLALTAHADNVESNLFKTKIKIELKDCYGSIIAQSQLGESRLKEFDKAYTQSLREAFETFREMDYNYQQKNSINMRAEDISYSDQNPELPKPKPKPPVEVKRENQTYISQNVDFKAIKYGTGYRLIDSDNNDGMILLRTPQENTFLVKDKYAIIFKQGGQWIYYESNDSFKLQKIINIEF